MSWLPKKETVRITPYVLYDNYLLHKLDMTHNRELIFLFLLLGMHKKSLEASKKMSEEESDLSENESGSEGKGRVKEERKSESIAALRAKAQQHRLDRNFLF